MFGSARVGKRFLTMQLGRKASHPFFAGRNPSAIDDHCEKHYGVHSEGMQAQRSAEDKKQQLEKRRKARQRRQQELRKHMQHEDAEAKELGRGVKRAPL